MSVISSEDGAIRHLPKIAWLLIVLFFPLAGSLAWLIAGGRRPRPTRRDTNVRLRSFPSTTVPDAPPPRSEADEKFLREVRERAEEQRRRYREQGRARSGRSHHSEQTQPGSARLRTTSVTTGEHLAASEGRAVMDAVEHPMVIAALARLGGSGGWARVLEGKPLEDSLDLADADLLVSAQASWSGTGPATPCCARSPSSPTRRRSNGACWPSFSAPCSMRARARAGGRARTSTWSATRATEAPLRPT